MGRLALDAEGLGGRRAEARLTVAARGSLRVRAP